LSRNRVVSVSGVPHIAVDRDPFILVLNHSTRLEALIVPALLLAARGGQKIPFLADWNFRLIPGIGLLYKQAGVVNVTRKDAKPRILNGLKPIYAHENGAWQYAEHLLQSGSSIAIFPEGTVNRDPARLLKGRVGAAYLSRVTGVPVVPAGLLFPGVAEGHRIPEGSPIALKIGTPLEFSRTATLRARHAAIMTAISIQSGKSWNP
jgi:1-acyl-sn-glycerol-3-phosphate acyltransferase